MIHASLEEAKDHLEDLIEKVSGGDTVRLYREGIPVADLTPIGVAVDTDQGMAPNTFYDPTEPDTPE